MLALFVVVILLYQYRHFLSFLQYRWMLKSAVEAKDQPKQQTEIVCPRCSDPMEEGYMLGPRGIYWNKDAVSLHNFGWHDLRSELLTSRIPFDEKTGQLKAYRCMNCAIIRIDIKSQNRYDFL
jgi:hypothetical protein